MSLNENRVRNIQNLVQNAERDLRKAVSMLEALLKEPRNEFEDIPGIMGVYDGAHMICSDGKSFDVNPNYAAKSMLVVGDNLKMIDEAGKQIFKQVSKVDRKKLSGILNKKEGSWYALTDAGSYKLLDAAVEFRRRQINDEIEVLIPENMLNVEFAALEKLAKEDNRPIIDEEKAAKYLAEKNRALTGDASFVSHNTRTSRDGEHEKTVSKSKSAQETLEKSEGVKLKMPKLTTSRSRTSDSSRSPKSNPARPESRKSVSRDADGTSRGVRHSDSSRATPSRIGTRGENVDTRQVDESQAKTASVQSILEDDDLV
ncbi:hypothetical protein HYV31_01200 [candidate division WWE3 bacterium]|nr:hypothetical protein [candidate division WWE3 bacterium]